MTGLAAGATFSVEWMILGKPFSHFTDW